jgi:hypothetical protein
MICNVNYSKLSTISLHRTFFDELDTLSTHTRPQGAEDVEVEIKKIDEEWIRFRGTGSVLCDLPC